MRWGDGRICGGVGGLGEMVHRLPVPVFVIEGGKENNSSWPLCGAGGGRFRGLEERYHSFVPVLKSPK